MKRLFLFFSSILLLSINLRCAQTISNSERDKEQILELLNNWCEKVLIDQNTDDIKNIYSKSVIIYE